MVGGEKRKRNKKKGEKERPKNGGRNVQKDAKKNTPGTKGCPKICYKKKKASEAEKGGERTSQPGNTHSCCGK